MSSHEQSDFTPQPISNEQYREIFRAGQNIAMRVHGDFHAAEDAAQESALMLWQAQEHAAQNEEAPIARPLAFALRVALHAAKDEREHAAQIDTNSAVVESVLADFRPDPLETVDARDAVMRAIQARNYGRTDDIRVKIFQLTLANFEPRYVAELLGIENKIVHWHLNCGKERVREQLEELGL